MCIHCIGTRSEQWSCVAIVSLLSITHGHNPLKYRCYITPRVMGAGWAQCRRPGWEGVLYPYRRRYWLLSARSSRGPPIRPIEGRRSLSGVLVSPQGWQAQRTIKGHLQASCVVCCYHDTCIANIAACCQLYQTHMWTIYPIRLVELFWIVLQKSVFLFGNDCC